MTVKTASRIDKLVALLAVVALAAQRQKLPADLWAWVDTNAGWIILALLLLTGIFSLSPLASRAESRVANRRTSVQRLLFSSLGHMLDRLVSTDPKFKHDDLGMHIWKVKRHRWKFWEQKLERVGTYRLGGRVNLRDFRPAKGEGVAGLCWKFNREFAVNVEDLRQKISSKAAFEKYKLQHGADAVMNLTWDGFNEVKHRGAIAASPIRTKSGKFRGCISIDTSGNYSDFNQSGVQSELNELAESLSAHPFEEM